MCNRKISDDRLLVEELKANNEKAFSLLFEAYRDDVYAYSKSFLKTQTLAEEIVQDVFLKVWQHRENLNPDLSFKSYLFTITRNLTFNLISKVVNNRKMKEEVFYKSQKFHIPIHDKIADAHYETLKENALAQLPPKRKVIFIMSRKEGMSYDEISKELNISVSTVKGQMSKALAAIRGFLEAHADVTFLITIIPSLFAG